MCEPQQQQQQQQQHQEGNENLTLAMLSALSQISNIPMEKLKLKTHAISGVGENSYGLIMEVNVKSIDDSDDDDGHYYIMKIAPNNPARRTHQRVAEFYAREVFMYKDVFGAYRNLLLTNKQNNLLIDDLVPKMHYYSLEEGNEFIIFEDLLKSNYIGGQRTQLPDYSMVAMALRSIAKLHALSFAMQSTAATKKDFQAIIAQLLPDNLFSQDIPQISIDFGKSYIRRARNLILMDKSSHDERIENDLKNVEKNFKTIGLNSVDGGACAPYAVICHGDFWNNNLLYKYDKHSKAAIAAKLIDFQLSRYASPILDLVHFLFVCTTHDLRKLNFENFLYDIYYATLSEQLQEFQLNVSTIYPRDIFERQLHEYGAYGLCMAAFSLPFFVADAAELLDLDKVCEAIGEISEETTSTLSKNEMKSDDNDDEKEHNNDANLKLIEEDFNLLTVRTAEIFKQRMIEIVEDIIKYNIKTIF